MLLVGFAVTNQAVCAQLVERGHPVVAADDAPDDRARGRAETLGVELLEGLGADDWADLVAGARVVVPTPGLPESHPSLGAAAAAGTSIISEFDLAQRWDARPTLAVTGTNGKTTVTLLAGAMLEASGIAVSVAGNTETPLVEAIRSERPTAFVVEASSFRLGHSRCYRPAVGAWLNFAPDHLDVHASLASYRAAKATLWSRADQHAVAVVNRDDPVVASHAPQRGRVVTFGLQDGDFRVGEGALWAGKERLAGVMSCTGRSPTSCPITWPLRPWPWREALTGTASERPCGKWTGLPHRVALVAEHRGVRFIDDSKATTPHAVSAALRSVAGAVLIAGGRNKGLDLAPMAEAGDGPRAVVAIGRPHPRWSKPSPADAR